MLLAAPATAAQLPPWLLQLEHLQLRPLCREMALASAGFGGAVRKAERLLVLQGSSDSLLPSLGFGIAVRSVPARLLHRYCSQTT